MFALVFFSIYSRFVDPQLFLSLFMTGSPMLQFMTAVLTRNYPCLSMRADDIYTYYITCHESKIIRCYRMKICKRDHDMNNLDLKSYAPGVRIRRRIPMTSSSLYTPDRELRDCRVLNEDSIVKRIFIPKGCKNTGYNITFTHCPRFDAQHDSADKDNMV